ncbi:MAG: DUF1566 domain-containing protein [Bacillus subtilis]|nr:DUF1566 domain-containing protein [Bacillus subtilis]
MIFVDQGDGTISDEATLLMWSQSDSEYGMDWESALAWVQTKNSENYLGYHDWRLPNTKELQSIVDYTRAPGETDSAAIDPMFSSTKITNEAGKDDYGFYWSSTTHLGSSQRPGEQVLPICVLDEEWEKCLEYGWMSMEQVLSEVIPRWKCE